MTPMLPLNLPSFFLSAHIYSLCRWPARRDIEPNITESYWHPTPWYSSCRCSKWRLIDYRCADKKKLPSWKATLAPFDRSWLHLSEKPDVHPQKNKPLGQEMHLKIVRLSSGLKMSGALEKLLFTYLWNRYNQQIPGINLIQVGANRQHPCFTAGRIWCWKLPCHVGTSENDCLHNYSLCGGLHDGRAQIHICSMKLGIRWASSFCSYVQQDSILFINPRREFI